jgi:hypothetical protein
LSVSWRITADFTTNPETGISARITCEMGIYQQLLANRKTIDDQRGKSYPACGSRPSTFMQIDYELRQDDFIESFAAHRNRNIFSKWLIRLLMSFAIVVAVFLAFGLIVRPNAQDTKNLMPFFGLILLWVGDCGVFHGGALVRNS